MPPTNVPTLRQRRLGAELRKLRERAGLSSTAAAARLGVQQARMSMIEAGRYAVSADRVRAMAISYSCTDPALIDSLANMTGGRTRGWWDEYRELLPAALIDLAELEHHAKEVRVVLAIHLPGLLQTADHIRALFQEGLPELRPHEIEHRLSYRIRRQEVLHRKPSIPYTAIIHEAALRMQVGGPATLRAQLGHLLEMSELDNITLRVIPFEGGSFSGNGQPMDYVYGAVRQLDTVQLDVHHGCEFLDAESELTKYRSVIDRMQSNALTPETSRDFIHNIARSL
ncbi:helix-turn-helix transcriptional regulator [Streptomyces sp. UNOC14_S4]|uniref:helix-turn-helix domain-containing protein n=1 Tax=Streptomyces sp. UNOC14_S4 TaxID=2872340 RepID=UPI001E3C8D8F|nr:helix-turn-helix transcriptional regulator [Streptomyces sp. UNOC14_S4]MCC3771548.1 helix-turn-helix transcriptional regulator [Streptomyces sp. UNOC14_S4]